MSTETPAVALVTGAASGIGRATALALAARGDWVAAADQNLDGAQACAAEIEQAGGRALALRLDVTDAASVEQVFAQTEASLGCVDILVNSAGIADIIPVLDYPMDAWERLLAINVTGSFRCAQRAARGMVKRGYGRIVNLASVSGFRAGIGRAAYGTSKAAVIGLTRQLAMELAPYGVTANAVAPGPVITGMTADIYTPATIETLEGMVPTGRLGSADEIAAGVVFLASRAASYVNGHILAVDGGYLASGMNRTGNLAR